VSERLVKILGLSPDGLYAKLAARTKELEKFFRSIKFAVRGQHALYVPRICQEFSTKPPAAEKLLVIEGFSPT